MKKKRPKPASQKAKPKTARAGRLESVVPRAILKPRELLSTRETGLAKSYSGKRTKKQPALKPRVKHISQTTIRSKWTGLSEVAQTRVANLFRSVELPVLARCISEQKKIEAQVTLRSLSRTLVYTPSILIIYP